MGAVPIPLRWVDGHARLVGLVYLAVMPLCIVLIAGFLYADHRNTATKTTRLARQGAEAHAAICTFRTDLEQRAAGTRQFLKANPAGPYTAAIRVALTNEEASIATLSTLNCSKGAP